MDSSATAYELGYEAMAAPWWLVLLEGIIALIVGLFLIFYPGITTVTLITVLGIFWLFGGIFALVGLIIDRSNWGWKLLSGILGILAGLAILAYPYYSSIFLLSFFVIMIAIWAIIYGAVRLAWGFKGGGWGSALLGILIIFLGILLLVNPLSGAVVLPWIFGILAIFGGVMAIVAGLMMR